jgi:hypothetical protein
VKKQLIHNPSIIIIFLLFSSLASKGQNYIYDIFPGDTISVIVTGSNDTIQWQRSADSINWTNISGAITNQHSIIYTASDTGLKFYRARLTNATKCSSTPWYSSTIRHHVITSGNQIQLGDWFHGGIVFFKDNYGHFSIAPVQNQSISIQWGCMGTTVSGAFSNSDGKANTSAIISGCTSHPIAASICDSLTLNGYSDWYLPSINELNYLYAQKNIVGGFSTYRYWSSTEVNANSSLIKIFSNGVQYTYSKSTTSAVRCIRSIITTPTITTASVSSITNSTATSGGTIISDGGATIIAQGVCWNTSRNPTTSNSKTIDGSGTGSFTSSITGLTFSTKYYIRSYATNNVGTSYGNNDSFTTNGIAVGQSYQGGIVAYILQNGDPGYVAGQAHGLIAAPTDQSAGIQWYNGTYNITGATGTALGTGNSNTFIIITHQGYGNYAALLCYDLILGGYSDWYLPSKDELTKVSLALHLTYGNNLLYWSSTEDSQYYATLYGAGWFNQSKNYTLRVRAVRSF